MNFRPGRVSSCFDSLFFAEIKSINLFIWEDKKPFWFRTFTVLIRTNNMSSYNNLKQTLQKTKYTRCHLHSIASMFSNKAHLRKARTNPMKFYPQKKISTILKLGLASASICHQINHLTLKTVKDHQMTLWLQKNPKRLQNPKDPESWQKIQHGTKKTKLNIGNFGQLSTLSIPSWKCHGDNGKWTRFTNICPLMLERPQSNANLKIRIWMQKIMVSLKERASRKLLLLNFKSLKNSMTKLRPSLSNTNFYKKWNQTTWGCWAKNWIG